MSHSPAPCRRTFVLKVYPGKADEYVRIHNPVWPELSALLSEHGARNYSLHFSRETRQVFGYMELESEERWAAIYENPLYQRWRQAMCRIIESHPDGSPILGRLEEIFHLA